MPDISIFYGSKSDYEIVQKGIEILNELGIEFTSDVASAHRTPQRTISLIQKYEQQGTLVFIGVAGMSAALPGFIAAFSTRPVIGVPVDAGVLKGIDALLSMVQMPKGIPVATMGIGSAGMKNAVLFAAQIVALVKQDLKLLQQIDLYKHPEGLS